MWTAAREFAAAERYLKTLVDAEHPFSTILSDAQPVYLGKDLPGEYRGSEYTKTMLPRLRTVKMQAATNLDEMLLLAENGEWRENVKPKHARDAKNGWYRYETQFAVPVLNIKKAIDHYTVYDGTLLIRNDADGKSYLYDLLDIEKKKVISAASFSAKPHSEVLPPKPSSENIIRSGGQNVKGENEKITADAENDGRLTLPTLEDTPQPGTEQAAEANTAPVEPMSVQQAWDVLSEFEGEPDLTEAQQRMVDAARETVQEWENSFGQTERTEQNDGTEQTAAAAEAGADPAVRGQERESAENDALADRAVAGGGQPRAAAQSQSKTAARRSLKAEQLRLKPVSTKSLGLENGTDRARVTVYPREAWDAELTQAAKALEDKGYEVQFVLGALEFAKPAMLTDGCVVGDKVIVRANSMRHTATELCEHERFHTLMNENPGASAMIWEKVDAELRDSRYDRLVEQYVQTYLEAYEGDEARIREELMADAYAGLNRFGEMPEAQRMVRELAQQFESGEAADLLQGQVEPGVRSSQTAREQNRTRDGTRFSYSIGEIVGEDQKNYGIGVHLDSTLLENLTPKERTEMVKERVKELGGEAFTAYDGAGNAVDISIAKPEERFKNRNGKTKPVNKDLTTKYSGNETKQESVVLLNELIETANFDASKEPTYPHDWLDNNGKNEWDYWTTYVQGKNGAIWEATLNVANAADGRKILYDIGPIKKVGQSVKSDTSLLSTGQRGNSRTSTVKASVAEKLPSVKGQYSLTQATEGRKMNSRTRRDVNQTMNAVQIAGDKKPESALRSLVRGTPEGTRTPNPQNRNLMLYPLSHWRVYLYIITHDAEKSSGGMEKLRGGKPVPLQREMAAVTGKNPRPQTFENQAQRAAAGRA